MKHIDGFQTTDSFRFDQNKFSSSISLSSSSGYGSRLSLFHTDQSASSNRRISLTKYFKEKLSRHKSLASLLQIPSVTTKPEINNSNTDIYDNVWNLDEQIEKFHSNFNQNYKLQYDSQSIISMSVDSPKTVDCHIDDKELLSAACWYQEGIPNDICEEYLIDKSQPIGSFLIRYDFNTLNNQFILSVKINETKIQHYIIKQRVKDLDYQIENSSRTFANLSTLVIHHTIMKENLSVTLVLPHIQQQSSLGIIRSVRF